MRQRLRPRAQEAEQKRAGPRQLRPQGRATHRGKDIPLPGLREPDPRGLPLVARPDDEKARRGLTTGLPERDLRRRRRPLPHQHHHSRNDLQRLHGRSDGGAPLRRAYGSGHR